MNRKVDRNLRRLTGSRVICVSNGQLLLVLHQEPVTGIEYWVPPGGGREAGETFEQTAVREVLEETGVSVRVIRRVHPPSHVRDVSYALFVAAPFAHVTGQPTVDLSCETYLRDAAWHPITELAPIGPLQPEYWGYLAPLIRGLLKATPTA